MSTTLPTQALMLHAKALSAFSVQDALQKDTDRQMKMSVKLNPLWFDYSHQQVTGETVSLLIEYANKLDLSNRIKMLTSGRAVNPTENRPAWHTILRQTTDQGIPKEVLETKEKCKRFIESVQQATYTDLIVIGIGGSHLGPLMTSTALQDFAVSHIQCHFLSTVDPAPLYTLLPKLDPRKTLVMIASKSFTTLETMTNSQVVREWLVKHLGEKANEQLIAITAKPDAAMKLGILPHHIFPMWDYIGGRFSIWSAIGLPLMLKIGWAQFLAFLEGGYEIDEHFQHAPLTSNIPVLMGLIDFWNQHFLGAQALAIIPYSARLTFLTAYLQQLSMESLGKSVNLMGETLNYQTGQVIFGQEGCEGQHAYHQLLHQGTSLIPADFIIFAKAHHANMQTQHNILLASALSQASALTNGKHDASLPPHQIISGNKPYNILCFDSLTPHTLGMLIALYEHKTFVQSVLLNINAFDQFGVELGKALLPDILQVLQNNLTTHDHCLAGIMSHIKNVNGHQK